MSILKICWREIFSVFWSHVFHIVVLITFMISELSGCNNVREATIDVKRSGIIIARKVKINSWSNIIINKIALMNVQELVVIFIHTKALTASLNVHSSLYLRPIYLDIRSLTIIQILILIQACSSWVEVGHSLVWHVYNLRRILILQKCWDHSVLLKRRKHYFCLTYLF
jgi:hypothetical protein